MDTFESIDNSGMKREPRPTFLTVLCILSFIAIGLTFSSGFTSLFYGPMGEEEMAQLETELSKSSDELRSLDAEGMAEMVDTISKMQISINENHYAVNTTNVLVALIGLIGVIFMWQGKKLGFHLYIIYCLLASVVLYFFIPSANIPSIIIIFNLVLSGIFIFMYSRNLKWLI